MMIFFLNFYLKLIFFVFLCFFAEFGIQYMSYFHADVLTADEETIG